MAVGTGRRTIADRHPRPLVAGLLVAAVAAGWLQWRDAGRTSCDSMSCVLDGLLPSLLGIVGAAIVLGVILRLCGPGPVFVPLLALGAVAALGPYLLGGLGLPSLVWPVVLGALTAAWITTWKRRRSGQ